MSSNLQKRILVVDDNKDVADSLSFLLWTLGYPIIYTAYSGREALEAAAKYQPDIILLDLMMPELDGFETARRIRAEPWGKAVRLVALTALDSEDLQDRLHQAGFDHHVVKPAEIGALEALL